VNFRLASVVHFKRSDRGRLVVFSPFLVEVVRRQQAELDRRDRRTRWIEQSAAEEEVAMLHVGIHRVLAAVEAERVAPVPILDRDQVAIVLVA
jgi:hypothetical protein